MGRTYRSGGNSRMGPLFEAKWGGRCGLCDDKYDAGDMVAYFDGEVCHGGCAEKEDDS